MPGALGGSGPHAPGKVGEKDTREGTFLLPGGGNRSSSGGGGEEVFKLSFVRDPLTRFVSAYSALVAAGRLPPSLMELPEPTRAQHVAKKALAGRHLPDGDLLLSQVRTEPPCVFREKTSKKHPPPYVCVGVCVCVCVCIRETSIFVRHRVDTFGLPGLKKEGRYEL